MARMPFSNHELLGPSPLWQVALGVLAGSCLLHLLPRLTEAPWLAAVFIALALCRPLRRVALAAALMHVWTWWQASEALADRWPSDNDGQTVVVIGEVTGLPTANLHGQRFEVSVRWPADVPAKLLLSADAAVMSDIWPGQIWTMRVELTAPRGYGNPTSFDRPRWMLVRGFGASGRVLAATGDDSWNANVDAIRDRFGHRAVDGLPEGRSRALLQTLMVADRRGLQAGDQTLLRHAGLAHIAAISGLHISISAAVGSALGWLLTILISRVRMALAEKGQTTSPDPARWAVLCGLGMAFSYAMLAGMPLSAQRALIAFAVFSAYTLASRRVPVASGLAAALIAVLILDPLSPLDGGFWLSFAAVTVLYLGLRGRGALGWRSAVRAQLLLTVALPPLTWLLFGEAPVWTGLANLLAVPWASLVLVPLALAAMGFAFLGPANPFLWLAFAAAEWLWWLADWVTGFSDPVSRQLRLGVVFMPALVLMMWLIWPTSRLVRASILVGLSFLLPQPVDRRPGHFQVTVFDTGQGLAALIETGDGAVLYDTAPRYRSGFDVAAVELVPYLNATDVALDRVVISHWDMDHAGGLNAVLQAYPQALVQAPDDRGHVRCEQGQHWVMGHVTFRVLHPSRYLPYQGNDSSCVLHVSSDYGSILLPGDITAVVEQGLAKRAAIDADVLILSHHGSKHSNTNAFLQAVGPTLAIATAGYRNRFAMPTREVLARAEQHRVDVLQTAIHGAISLSFNQDGLSVSCTRTSRHRYWDFELPQEKIAALTNHSCKVGAKTSIIPSWLAFP